MRTRFSSDIVRREFSSRFESQIIVLPREDEVGQDFADRNGRHCTGLIPRLEAFASVYVAERTTNSDAEQVAEWRAAGLAECPPLDVCFSVEEETRDRGVGTFQPTETVAPPQAPVPDPTPLTIPRGCEALLSSAFVQENVTERYVLVDNSDQWGEFE